MPSARFTGAALAQESAELPIYLLTIYHAAFSSPIRWATGGADIVSNGETFVAVAMKIQPPGDSVDASGRRSRVTVDNVGPEAIGKLRTATSRPSAKIEIVLAGYPDDVEVSWSNLQLTEQKPGAQGIELELVEREDTGEIFPYQAFSPHRVPGLFDL